MGIFRSVGGMVSVEITTADAKTLLHAIQSRGIELTNVQMHDELCVVFQIKRKDMRQVRRIADLRSDGFRLREKSGLYWYLMALRKRPVLVVGLMLLLVLNLAVQSRVLFVLVEGNVNVPTGLILEKAANCGITLGATTRQIRSEQVKNMLLSEIQDLQWVGVNMRGCVAVISVKERQKEPEQQETPGISSIYAEVDALIISATAQKGTLLCKPGDAVTAGQKLISGFTDCGIHISASDAKGEVYGLTDRTVSVVSPIEFEKRGATRTVWKKYALLLGKKQINFYKDSGILDATCARINSVWYMTLPGGFVLPIGLLCQVYTLHEQAPVCLDPVDLDQFARSYILSQMRAGEILTLQEEIQSNEDVVILRGRYACREQIGISRTERNWNEYGKDP